jgi:hypothetical protein
MSKQNSNNLKDKVVFTFALDSQYRNTKNTVHTYRFVEKIIEAMLRKNNIETDCIFLGAENKNDLFMFISGLIEMYQYMEIDITDETDKFILDDDFEI